MTLDASNSNAVRSKSAPRKRRLASALAGLVVMGGIAAGLASSSCVAAEGKFYISSGAAVTFAMGGATCNMTPCGSTTMGWHVNVDQAACFIVNSGLIPRLKVDTNHVETNRILVHEVDIEVFGPGGALVDSFTRAAEGSLDPSVANQPMPFTILRPESTTNLPFGSQAVVGIVLKGRTTGGLDIESPEFYAPIYVNAPISSTNGTSCSGLAI